MGLAAVVEKLDGVEEALRPFYKENADGKWVLDADVDAHPAVRGLKSAYTKDHEKVRELSGDLAKYKDIDVERWNTLKDLTDEDLEALKVARTRGSASSGNGHSNAVDIEAEINKRVGPMKSAHQREIEAREELLRAARAETAKLADDMRRTKIETALMSACTAEGVEPSAIEEIVEWGSKFFKINDDGEIVAVDRSGTDIFGSDSKPMKPREWIVTRAQEKKHWFPLSAGGGASGGRYGGETRPTRKSQLRDLKAKVDFIKKYGSEAFENLTSD